jgi:hypothetical protein
MSFLRVSRRPNPLGRDDEPKSLPLFLALTPDPDVKAPVSVRTLEFDDPSWFLAL